MVRKLWRGLTILALSLGILMPILAQETSTPTPTDDLINDLTITATDVLLDDLTTTPTLAGTQTPTLRPTPAGTPTPTRTPTPEVSPLITFWSDEMIYPLGIYFEIDIARTLDQIQQLTLSLTITGRDEPVVLDLEALGDGVIGGFQKTFVRYTWEVPENDPPPFLSAIGYEWNLLTTRGEVATFPGILAYTDPDIDWQRVTDSERKLSFIYPRVGPENPIDPLPLRRAWHDVYDLLAENVGGRPHYRFALYNEAYPFSRCQRNEAGESVVIGIYGRFELPCNPAVMANILADAGFTPVEASASGGFALQQQISRLMVEDFHAEAWANSDLPAWFTTGVTYLYFPDSKRFMLELLRMHARTQALFTIEEMNSPDPTASDFPIWESQAYTMVLYMARQIGVDAIFQLAVPDADSPPFEQAYVDVMAQPLAGLLPTLNNWIFSRSAESDFALRLYTGPTAIPSPTNTITPFPSSPTPTASNTPTITPTPTVTGVLTATPLPTLTPSATAKVTATITPRPAGSANTPVPSATPVIQTALDSDSNSDNDTIIALLMAAIVVLFAAIFTLGYRIQRSRVYKND